jgi:hypothetical protein
MDMTWQQVQKKSTSFILSSPSAQCIHVAFTKWVNTKIAPLQLQVEDLAKDLNDGHTLLQLLEAISGKRVGKYNKKAKLRIQKVENLNLALKFIKENGVQLTNIGAEGST